MVKSRSSDTCAMPPGKKLRKEELCHKVGITQSSKVYIIKLEPAKSCEDEVVTCDNAKDSIVNESQACAPSSDEVLCDETSRDSSSCDFSLLDKFECNLEVGTQSEQDLLVKKEPESDVSEFPCDPSRNVSPVVAGYDFKLNVNLESAFQDSVDFDDTLHINTQSRREKSTKSNVLVNTKKLRGWNATRGKVIFQEKWLKEFPFLEYDKKNNLMFCRACRKYVNDWRKKTPFVIGNCNFRESMIRYHERSSMHAECQELADTVASEGDEAVDKDLYREQLSHVFKSVYFIFKNKMPFTHYPQLCASQKREGTDFSVYTSHLKVVPLFGKFICMAFEKEVAKKLETVTEFSLIIDASFRRNIESHDLVYLKYLDDDSIVKTVFLGVIDSSAKLHDSIYSLLCDLFKRYGVNSWIDKIVYIMTDKSDKHLWLEGLNDLIKSMGPQNYACSTTYLSHKIKYCASVVQNHKISSTFDALLWSMYCYYEKIDKSKKNLPHMNQELDRIVDCYGNLPKNSYTTLYYEALIAIEEDYDGFVKLLESEQLMLHYDAKVRKAGARILSTITRSCFLCKLALFIDIFSCLTSFADQLSKEDILPFDVQILLEKVCTDIDKAASGEGSKCLEIAEELVDNPCSFRGLEVVEDGSIKHVLPDIKEFSKDVISYLRSLIDDDSLLEKCYIFNVSVWPEDEGITEFGNTVFLEIFAKFYPNVNLSNNDHLSDEWKEFKAKVVSIFPFEIRQNSKSVISRMVSEYEHEFPNVIALLKKILLLNFESSEIKRGYHEMCLNKSFSRSMLSLQSLQTSMIISMYGPALNDFDFSLALDLFLNSRHRKYRKKIIDKKLLDF